MTTYKVSETDRLRPCVQQGRESFPKEFIQALEGLLDTGLSCVQITSFLIVIRGISELQDDYDEGELLGKSVEILRIMQHLRTLKETESAEDSWFQEDNDEQS